MELYISINHQWSIFKPLTAYYELNLCTKLTAESNKFEFKHFLYLIAAVCLDIKYSRSTCHIDLIPHTLLARLDPENELCISSSPPQYSSHIA